MSGTDAVTLRSLWVQLKMNRRHLEEAETKRGQNLYAFVSDLYSTTTSSHGCCLSHQSCVWDSAWPTMSVWTVCVALVFAVSAGSLVACCSENYHGKFHWTWVLSSLCVWYRVAIVWVCKRDRSGPTGWAKSMQISCVENIVSAHLFLMQPFIPTV